jgi:AmmeMemoRadiSam system protein B
MPAAFDRPRLRPVEIHPSRTHPGGIDIVDRSGISPAVLTVSEATLFILSRMDGGHHKADIQAAYMRRYGRMLFSDELDNLIARLDEAAYLEGPGFDARLADLAAAYRAAPVRPLRDPAAYSGPPGGLDAALQEMLDFDADEPPVAAPPVAGLVAPHLDYPRGRPCYAAAYRGLARRTPARRFVILGTNHFGRASAVVGTRKDFETPLGPVPHDADFMRRLDARCGADLCGQEFDHAREHSVELQVVVLRRVLGDRAFTIAPYLCPDPCGPTGTAPADGRGVDLERFALALREEIDRDPVPTCVIAGADLSHVGRFFQDERDLTPENLAAVEASDRAALARLEAGEPEAFRAHVAASSNATHICSVGCLYALGRIMAGRTRPRLLGYHQAVTPEVQNCVSCAAMEYPG